ncbi:hypothetical protein [Allorhizocola rhizosphaerae]|uniref:hypothetical protein n=1 Tax=Allorhizocola rhizosphaerae TaxID=1872709 RepID=UPI000E3CF80E|nr:hypothetical protein [Allorhizocola rhizosphaerae]
MVRWTNTPIVGCYMGVRATVDVEQAAVREVVLSDGFVQHEPDDGMGADEIAKIEERALAGVRSALDDLEPHVGPLRVVLVRHVVHPVDSSCGGIYSAASRAVRESVEQLPVPVGFVRHWLAATAEPGGCVRARVTNPADAGSAVGGVRVTIEVERGPARKVEISRRFVVVSDSDRESVTEARVAELEQGAVRAVNEMLDELEPRTGPLRVNLVRHRFRPADSTVSSIAAALDRGLRRAVQELDSARPETLSGPYID